MSMIKRVLLFGMVNIAVIATISIVTSVLGIKPYLTSQGINYESLLIFCALWGFAGAFISLAMSKWMAKRMMGVRIIPKGSMGMEGELVSMVHRLAGTAGLKKMPEVGIYDSPEVNAFATGPSKSNSLVAVSTGLLNSMNKDEVEGVLAHEVAHIANGDMVTMTLVQGVINAFVMFFARIAAFALSNVLQGDDEEKSPWMQMGLVFLFDILFSILGSIVVNYFSRLREFKADSGAAKIAGKDKMIAALERLKNNVAMVDQSDKAFASMKISGGKTSLAALFSTHPSLDDRINALRKAAR